MEDLFPLLIFLVIVAINAIKFFAEKAKTKKPAAQSGEAPPKRAPSSIETFFERLAKQMEPQPTELPDWPEGRDRPDYVHEMEEFESPLPEDSVEPPPAVIIPIKASPPPTLAVRTKTRLRIKGRKNLKRAMLAHIVFSPPRALDPALKHNLVK